MESVDKDNINDYCKWFKMGPYTINDDGAVDVERYVDISNMSLKEIPIQFGCVRGDFYCSYNVLTTIKGAPVKVDGNFSCDNSYLKTLRGGPLEVGEEFSCYNNNLTILLGGPVKVGTNYNCAHNKLVSLKGSPEKIECNFYCMYNKLTTLNYCPKYIKGHINFGGNKIYNIEEFPKGITELLCKNTPLYEIYSLFDGNFENFINSFDMNYLRGVKINKRRFEVALREIGKETPDKLNYYNYF
jgi:hypothetical protein